MQRLEITGNKIYTKEVLSKRIAVWRFLGRKIVFTNGCFDILHLGHIDYLSKASDLGNVLIIGLNSDMSVKKIKGKSRPVNDENSRKMILASLSFVDAVILFDEETPYELIKFINPDVLVKGSDYKPDDIVGADIIKANGGKIITIDLVPGYSTSAIEKRIKEEK